MTEVLTRECTYLWYYCSVQFRQIALYWIVGMAIGSFVSVFLKEKIRASMQRLGGSGAGLAGIFAASALGVASPLCMYGTVPIAASFSKGGMRHDWLAAFMMSSVLLNPQLIVYSAALGLTALTVRVVSCYLCGVAAGVILRVFYKNKPFFRFDGFEEKASRDTDPNVVKRYLKNLLRNCRATGPYFLLGILLSALFQRYVPEEFITRVFGGNEALGVFMAATVGVPLYACGGGTIPLLQGWLSNGMNLGSAAAFMLTGPATKITNLGALKIVLGTKRFVIYLAFVILYALLTGLIVDLILA